MIVVVVGRYLPDVHGVAGRGVDSVEGKTERYKGVKGFKNKAQDLLNFTQRQRLWKLENCCCQWKPPGKG